MSFLRRCGRLAALLGVLLVGVGLVLVLPLLPEPARRAAGRTWARGVLRALGVRLVVRGRLPRRRALLAANHISWLDVLALLAVAPARMVAKREVRGWPVLGSLAAVGGAIFLDRTRPRTLPTTVAEVGAALRAGAVVAVFPEGTTWCGGAAGPRGAGVPRVMAGRFRPAMFQAAIDAGVMVVPVTVRYLIAGREGTTAAAFLGQESLWTSLRRVLAARGLVVSLIGGGALYPEAVADRCRLAGVAESAVRLLQQRDTSRYAVGGNPPSVSRQPWSGSLAAMEEDAA